MFINSLQTVKRDQLEESKQTKELEVANVDQTMRTHKRMH